jgi:bifunctional non-homologous end joining protein LigD
VHVGDAGTRIFTRSGLDWIKRFTSIAAEFAGTGLGQATVDGEIVVVVGKDRFRRPPGRPECRTSGPHAVLRLDLLYADGYDLRKVALLERKRLLEERIERTGLAAPVLYSEHMDDGAAMFAGAQKLTWEGIVSKRADAPYRSGDRSDSWQNSKPRSARPSRWSATCRP